MNRGTQVAHFENGIAEKKSLRIKMAFGEEVPNDLTLIPSVNDVFNDYPAGVAVTAKGFDSSAQLVNFLKHNAFNVGRIKIDTDNVANLDNSFQVSQLVPGDDSKRTGEIDWREERRESSAGDYLKTLMLPPSVGGFTHNGRKTLKLEKAVASSYIQFTIDVSEWDWTPALAPIMGGIK